MIRITILLLSVALSTSFVVAAGGFQDHDRDHDRDHGRDDHHMYDKKHKDYHDWNDHEDRAYHMYWEQRHKPYTDFHSLSERQQRDYWNWRHNHSDAILNIKIG